MKKKRFLSAALGVVCALSTLFGGAFVQAGDLTRDVTAADAEAITNLSTETAAVTDFSVELFKKSLDPTANTMVSPFPLCMPCP